MEGTFNPFQVPPQFLSLWCRHCFVTSRSKKARRESLYAGGSRLQHHTNLLSKTKSTTEPRYILRSRYVFPNNPNPHHHKHHQHSQLDDKEFWETLFERASIVSDKALANHTLCYELRSFVLLNYSAPSQHPFSVTQYPHLQFVVRCQTLPPLSITTHPATNRASVIASGQVLHEYDNPPRRNSFHQMVQPQGRTTAQTSTRRSFFRSSPPPPPPPPPPLARLPQPRDQYGMSPFLPYEKSLWVCDVGEKHVLLLNKYSIQRNHLLLVTRSFEKQTTKLTFDDFHAMWKVLKHCNGFAYFNGGTVAGASQNHKHMQFMPAPIVPDCYSPMPLHFAYMQSHRGSESSKFPTMAPQLPFLHAVEPLPAEDLSDREMAQFLKSMYDVMMEKLNTELNVLRDIEFFPRKSETSVSAKLRRSNSMLEATFPHNLLVTKDYMVMIPRKISTCLLPNRSSIVVNSLGFAGIFQTFMEAAAASQVISDPMRVLQAVSYPRFAADTRRKHNAALLSIIHCWDKHSGPHRLGRPVHSACTRFAPPPYGRKSMSGNVSDPVHHSRREIVCDQTLLREQARHSF